MAPDEGGVALKLRAEDGDDLAVLSACLQDAIVPVRDLAYVRDRQMFVFIANRFRWESGLRPAPGDFRRQRILCAVTFEAVDGASYRGFSRRDEDRILALLAIRPEPAPGGGRRSISNSRATPRSGSRSPASNAAPRIWASHGRPRGTRVMNPRGHKWAPNLKIA